MLLATLAARGRASTGALFIILEQNGLRVALDSLERRAATDSLVLRGGHQLAHALGRRALTSSGGDASLLGQCRPVFASGCYHGVVEGLLKLRGRVDMSELQQICVAAGGEQGPGPVHECAHGVGHGVLGAVGMDIRATLEHCDSLTRPSLVIACREGAFMDGITAALGGQDDPAHAHGSQDGLPERELHLDPANPYSPCDGYDDPHGESCWLFQGFVILRRVGFDAGRALRVCDTAPRARVDRCYQSVGHQLAGLFQRSETWIIDQCGKGDSKRAGVCASGAALALASMDWSGARVRRYCAVVPAAWSESCVAAAAGALALVS